MTITEPRRADALAAPLLAAATSIREVITGAGGWTVESVGADPTPPAPGSRAVCADLGPTTLVLLAEPGLARHLQVGPPPADDLVDGARPALEALASVLGPLVGATELVDVREVDPGDLPLAQHEVEAVRLLDDGAAKAVVILLVVPSPAAADDAPAAPAPGRAPAAAPPRSAGMPSGLELLHDVEMGVTAELGRTRLLVRDILDLVPGSVIELDRAAGSPVDVLVNGTLIARGEVVVIDEEFGIRITEVVGYEEERGL